MVLSREDDLLIRCSRVVVDDAAKADILDLLAGSPDWGYLLDASVRNAVSPLFYYGLKQVASDVVLESLVPAHVLDTLCKLYQNSRLRNRRLFEVTEEIARVFEQAGVQLMGLKDLQLAWVVYPDIGLRPMGDIDLLVRQEDYQKAAACMAGLGFSRLPDGDTPYLLKYAWEQQFRRLSDNVWVDLQWNVLQIAWDVYQDGPFDFEIDRMWQGAEEMAVGDSRLSVPRPEDMLFHLCMHLEGHRYAEQVLFCDLIEMLRFYAGSLDWGYFCELARRYQVESSIHAILLLLRDLFKISLPDGLLEALRPKYFKGELYQPLFGNLAGLHLFLDEIEQSVHPPQDVMHMYELTVRQQVAGAIQLYQEIDRVVSEFLSNGGWVAVLRAAPSPRIFPDPLLLPFGTVSLLVLDSDLPRMRQALKACNFIVEENEKGTGFQKTRPFVSHDPLLQGCSLTLTIQGRENGELDSWLCGEDPSLSKKETALQIIRSRLAGQQTGGERMQAVLDVIPLSPEDLVLALGDQFARHEQDRLFALAALLEFLGSYMGSLDRQVMMDRTQTMERGSLVRAGLLLAGALNQDDRLSFPGEDGEPNSALKLLEWARYGPDSLERYTELKDAFYYLLSLSSLQSLPARGQYILASLLGQDGRKAFLPGLAWNLMKNGLKLKGKSSKSVTHYAYWTEAEKPEAVDREEVTPGCTNHA